MDYFVYIIRSEKNGDIYVGSTSDISKRIARHNAGGVKSTKAYRPWRLLESTEYSSRSEAVRMELYLKTGQQKEMLRKRFSSAT